MPHRDLIPPTPECCCRRCCCCEERWKDRFFPSSRFSYSTRTKALDSCRAFVALKHPSVCWSCWSWQRPSASPAAAGQKSAAQRERRIGKCEHGQRAREREENSWSSLNGCFSFLRSFLGAAAERQAPLPDHAPQFSKKIRSVVHLPASSSSFKNLRAFLGRRA